jgi:AbrB family looped-hinge helix DNA binding protein
MQVIVSPKYQIVIPKEIRTKIGLRKGQRMHISIKGKSIVLMPDKPIQSLRGILKESRADHARTQGERK